MLCGKDLYLGAFVIDRSLQFRNTDLYFRDLVVEIGFHRGDPVKDRGLIRTVPGYGIVQLRLQIQDHLKQFRGPGVQISVQFRPQTFQRSGKRSDKRFQIDFRAAAGGNYGRCASGTAAVRIPYHQIRIMDGHFNDPVHHDSGRYLDLVNPGGQRRIVFQGNQLRSGVARDRRIFQYCSRRTDQLIRGKIVKIIPRYVIESAVCIKSA